MPVIMFIKSDHFYTIKVIVVGSMGSLFIKIDTFTLYKCSLRGGCPGQQTRLHLEPKLQRHVCNDHSKYCRREFNM